MTIRRREFLKITGTTVLCACASARGIAGCFPGVSSVALSPEGSYRQEGRSN